MKLTVRMLAGLLGLSIAVSANAGPLDKLVKYAKAGGAMVNVNSAGIASDQRAGYLMGGSVISRGARPKDLQLAMVQMPSFALDECTKSFDMRFGGFSYIKGKEILRYFKNTVSSAGIYATKMLLKNTSPVIENIMSELEAISRDINSHSYGVCQQAQRLARGGLAMLNVGMQQGCLQKSNLTSSDSDLFEAQKSCNENPFKYDDADSREELKNQLGSEFNLVWKALSQGAGTNDNNLKSLMMSISGTVIQRKGDGTVQMLSKPSLVESHDLIDHYMGQVGGDGTKVNLYVCDEPKRCLNPDIQQVVLRADETLMSNVEVILKSLTQKVRDNKSNKLSDEEEALVDFASIPIISQIERDLRRGDGGMNIVGSQEYLEVVSYDLVVTFLRKMLNNASNSVEQLESVSVDRSAFDRFARNVQVVRSYLNDKKAEAHRRLNMVVQMKEHLEQEEAIFDSDFSRFLDVMER